MIKYADVTGFKNYGEIAPHVYQFMQKEAEIPVTIIIHAYCCPTIAFKGYVFNNDKTYSDVDFTQSEIDSLEPYVGSIGIVKDVNEFLKLAHLESFEYAKRETANA